MPVTRIDQPVQGSGIVNFFIRQIGRLKGGQVNISPGPYPHDALNSKPTNFENGYNVSVTRLHIPDLPAKWEDKEHWQPLVIKRNTSTKAKRVLIYWHGGAFIQTMVNHHWNFLGRLANELEMDIVVQTYTMVPYAGIHQNIDKLVTMYQRVRDIAKQNEQELLIGGDSAGGHITAVMLLALNDRNLPFPDQAIMIAPGLVVDLNTPENRAIEPFDPMLTIDRLTNVTRAWATGPVDKASLLPPTSPTPEEVKQMNHPYAAPINGDWTFLKQARVPITVIIGTYDLLLPQVERFVQKAEAMNVDLTYIRAEGCPHVYPIIAELYGASYLAPDCVEGLRLMIESVKKYSKVES